MMNEMIFLIRHTPFWAGPLLVISLEFAYIFWLRKKKINVRICLTITLLCLVAICYYYWAGGPEKAVREFLRYQRSYLE